MNSCSINDTSVSFTYCKTPICVIEIAYVENKILFIKKAEKLKFTNYEFSNCLYPEIQKLKIQLNEYFSGIRKTFEINLDFCNATSFQKKVYYELLKIPYGKTSSYKQIAQKIDNPNASRAVSLACKRNPFLILVPCHRVISSQGNISGYVAGVYMKEYLLSFEKFN